MKGGLRVLKSFEGREFSQSPSPFTLWLNPTVEHVEKGHLIFSYLIRHDMTNPMKGLHGGVSAAIMDDIIGATIITFEEEYFHTTLNNVIDYFAPAFEREKILAETRVIKKGKQIVNVQCELWNADKSRLIARGYSNLLKTELRK